MYITTTSTESLPGMSPLPPLAMGTTVEHMVSHTASIYVAFQRSCTNYSCNEPATNAVFVNDFVFDQNGPQNTKIFLGPRSAARSVLAPPQKFGAARAVEFARKST